MAAKGIAIIGAGMIGAAHASGYRQFSQRFEGFTLDTVCDANTELAQKLARDWGFARVAQDWRVVIADPEIAVVSVCLPNFLHTEVTQAALAAGKHVLCEKPLALSAEAARPVRAAAKAASSMRSGTVFNYRRIPALADLRAQILGGAIGKPVQIIAKFQCDYAADPLLPHSWRYELDKAGPGALLDIGTHAVDMMRFLFGDIHEVTGAIATISIPERHLPKGVAVGHGHVELADETAVVDNDDVMTGLLRFANGAQGVMTASRVAVGAGNCLSVEVYGTAGTARFSTETPSYYEIARGPQGADFVQVQNRPKTGAIAQSAVPHDRVSIGYAEIFGFMISEFLQAIAEGKPFENGSIEDGYRAAQVLDAIQQASVQNAPVLVDWQD